MLTIKDLETILVKENEEPFVHYKGVFVRKTVAEKLANIEKKCHIKLVVVEGFRSMQEQERDFVKELLLEYQRDPAADLDILLERAHTRIALPSVAGHPTGGAVDVTFAKVDMGGAIRDFSRPELLPTFSPHVTLEQAAMRKLLHDLMVSEGFAPYYGEWWHFSYGDREWAAFYGKDESLYSQKEKGTP